MQPWSPVKLLRRARYFFFGTAAALMVLCAIAHIDWTRENRVLRRLALEATQHAATRADAIVALNHWVYGHEGFAKNRNYFLVKALGPTPLQILRSGGDCSDKSRLLSEMLAQIGISSGLVMIYPCASCSPIHTVVVATYENGRMVADPIWNIDYPAGNGKYYGVRDLAGTSRGRQHLLLLKAQNSSSAKIAAMPDTEATFDYATGLNWSKNGVMKTGAALLRRIHIEPALVLRPRIMEDPKLAIWVFLLLAALAMLLLGAGLSIAAGKMSAATASPAPGWPAARTQRAGTSPNAPAGVQPGIQK
jgi:hypothetical protein